MDPFSRGARVKVLCSGFDGLRWWPGTVTKQVFSFDRKDCKLSIKFDDNRDRRPFTYQFSKFSDVISLLEPIDTDLPSSTPEPDLQPSTPAPPEETPASDSRRTLRPRKPVDYTT